MCECLCACVDVRKGGKGARRVRWRGWGRRGGLEAFTSLNMLLPPFEGVEGMGGCVATMLACSFSCRRANRRFQPPTLFTSPTRICTNNKRERVFFVFFVF